MGSLKALEFLGKMTANGEGCKEDLQKALAYFKRGVKLGNRSCYAEMAEIYSRLNHFENAKKCYSNYFGSLDYNSIIDNDIFYFTSYIERFFDSMNEQYVPIFTLFRNEIIKKLEFFKKMAVDSNPDDEDYVNYVRTFRGKRISWLRSLKEPGNEPTTCEVTGIDKFEPGVVIFAEVIRGMPYSLSKGDHIILQSPSKILQVEILRLRYVTQTGLYILISENLEDYDKYLFIKEGATLKPVG